MESHHTILLIIFPTLYFHLQDLFDSWEVLGLFTPSPASPSPQPPPLHQPPVDPLYLWSVSVFCVFVFCFRLHIQVKSNISVFFKTYQVQWPGQPLSLLHILWVTRESQPAQNRGAGVLTPYRWKGGYQETCDCLLQNRHSWEPHERLESYESPTWCVRCVMSVHFRFWAGLKYSSHKSTAE